MKIIHLLPEIERQAWAKSGEKKRPVKGGQGLHHKNIKIPDETILSMRRMHEVEKKTIKQVQAAHPEITGKYVRDILFYITRTNLRLGKL